MTVFNADDHPILRKGITELITQTPGLNWAGSAADGKEAIEKLRANPPDIALLDIEMPNFTGLEVAKTLLAEKIPTKFILLTLFREKALIQQALAMGIKGYLLKESSEAEILDCIRAVAKGSTYVNPELVSLLMTKPAQQAEDNLLEQLSEHERNILKLIAREKTTAEIAGMLFLSPKTIANHRNNISKKLCLSGEQNGLLRWALSNRKLLS